MTARVVIRILSIAVVSVTAVLLGIVATRTYAPSSTTPGSSAMSPDTTPTSTTTVPSAPATPAPLVAAEYPREEPTVDPIAIRSTASIRSDDAVIVSSEVRPAPPQETADGDPGLIGDDYPYRATSMDDVDPWRFYFRNCTSFVAWRLNSANGLDFDNGYGGLGRWGNANTWDDRAESLGIVVDGTPGRGSVAQTDAGGYGHVAWVSSVNDDGTVTIEEYNTGGRGAYGTRRAPVEAFRYIHIRDL